MSDGQDWNGLDEAIFALGKSTAELPEVFRQLTEGELCALMPYHPEIVDTRMQIQNGSPFNFILTQDEEGEAVMLFSSEARGGGSQGGPGAAEHLLHGEDAGAADAGDSRQDESARAPESIVRDGLFHAPAGSDGRPGQWRGAPAAPARDGVAGAGAERG